MRRAVSPPAIPCAHRPQAARESRPSRLMPRRRDSGTPSVPATTSSPIPAGAQQLPTGRIPCPEGLGANAGFHAAHLRPFDPNTRPGAPWTRRVARRRAARKGRDTFSGSSPHALRARTTRKTAVGRLPSPRPTSLPPLQTRPRCMRLTRRKARHRGGPQSLRSKT